MDKKFSLAIAAAAALALLASCGNSAEKRAREIYTEAENLYISGDFDASLSKLSLIDSLYRDQISVRRLTRHLRLQVIEKQSLKQLSETDSLLALNQWIGDSLTKNFRIVDNAIEKYYVTKNAPRDINSRPGLYGRMSPDGVLYFMAVSPGVTANQIALNGSQSAVLPHDGERCAKYGANQVMTFLEAEIESVILAVANNTGTAAELTFHNNGTQTGKLTLSAADIEALGKVCQTAQNLRQFKVLQIEKERLERTITVARNQIARTMPDSTERK